MAIWWTGPDPLTNNNKTKAWLIGINARRPKHKPLFSIEISESAIAVKEDYYMYWLALRPGPRAQTSSSI